jgi:excisionase family DNA binding protein
MEKINNLITVRQAAKLSGYNPDYISSLIRSGKVRGKKVGKNWLTTVEEIKAYIESVEDQAHFSKLSGQSRVAARAGTWLRRRFSRAVKFTILVISFSVLLALLGYGAYAAVYNQAYTVAQSVSASSTTSASADSQIKSNNVVPVNGPAVINVDTFQ